MESITKTRGTKNVSSPVEVALYDADFNSIEFGALASLEPINIVKVGNDATGIRSRMDLGVKFSDIQGCKVGMITQIGNATYRDIVTIKGMTNSGYIVEFDDEPEVYYTVARAIARFVKVGGY